MRVIVDSTGLQAHVHLQDGKRLATFLALLRAIPSCEVAFSPEGPLATDTLAAQDVLVITTRKGDKSHAQTSRCGRARAVLEAPVTGLLRLLARRNNAGGNMADIALPARSYSAAELDAIVDFVRRGGGLLLLTNHGDAPRLSPYNMTQNDALLARRFSIEIENTFFANPDPNTMSKFTGPDLLATHPAIRGGAGESPVHSAVTHNCSSIVAPDGAPLVRLHDRMSDQRNGFSAQGRCFAVALENSAAVGKGRVVVMADSGFIGAEGTTFPGVGLIEHGDNARFALNAIRWLGHHL